MRERGPFHINRSVLVALLVLLSQMGARADDGLLLNGLNPGSEVALTLAPNGPSSVTLINSGGEKDARVSVMLTTFVGDDGSSMAAGISVLQADGTLTPVPSWEDSLAFTQPVLNLVIAPQAPTAAVRYTGRIVAWRRDGSATPAKPAVWPVALTPAPPASLAVFPELPPPLQIVRRIFGGTEPSLTVTLAETSQKAPLAGVFARLETLKGPGAGLDLRHDVDFTWNGTPTALPISPSASDAASRTIPPGQQALIAATFHNLAAGEYNGTLRFHAPGAANAEHEKLSFTIQVKESVFWAIVVLLVAISLSYGGTKWINTRRQRLALQERLSDLDADWLKQQPPLLPVVWVRAMLRQADDLSRRFWLRAPDEIDARVDQAAKVLQLLDQIRKFRRTLDHAGLPPRMVVRAIAALARISERLEAGAPDDQTAAQITADLTALNGWLDPNRREDLYWAAVNGEINLLLAQVDLNAVNDASAQIVVQHLVTQLNAAPPATLADKLRREEVYARLKILWERHQNQDLGKLVSLWTINAGAVQKDPELQMVFQTADECAWQRLLAAHAAQQIRILCPDAVGDRPAAYEPLQFRISTGDPALDATYLIRHGLRFCWTFTLTQPPDATEIAVLKPESLQPQIVQYAPAAGVLSATVEIWRGNDSIAVQQWKTAAAEPPSVFSWDIVDSQVFHFLEGFETTEVAALAMAVIAALATGLSVQYAKSPTWGSAQDMLTLFLWGIGIDQSKNFLQLLQSYSTWPSKPS